MTFRAADRTSVLRVLQIRLSMCVIYVVALTTVTRYSHPSTPPVAMVVPQEGPTPTAKTDAAAA